MLIHRVSWWIDASVLWLAPSLASLYDVMLDSAWVSNIDRMFVTHRVTCMSSMLHYKFPLANHLTLLVDITTKWLRHSINWAVHVSMSMARNSFCTLYVNTWCSTIIFMYLVLSVLNLSLALHGHSILGIVDNSFFLDDCAAGRLVRGDHWRGLLLSWHQSEGCLLLRTSSNRLGVGMRGARGAPCRWPLALLACSKLRLCLVLVWSCGFRGSTLHRFAFFH